MMIFLFFSISDEILLVLKLTVGPKFENAEILFIIWTIVN